MAESGEVAAAPAAAATADDAAPAKPAATAHVLAQAVLDFEEGDAQVRFGPRAARRSC